MTRTYGGPINEEIGYTREQLTKMVEDMQKVSNNFYGEAVKIGNHSFIEFAGLMNEYINMCAETLARDGDFTRANTHTGIGLVMMDYQAAYLAEKLNCIYGPTLAGDPKLAEEFVKRVVKP